MWRLSEDEVEEIREAPSLGFQLRPSEPATEWHVLMSSGWLPLFPYRDGYDWSAIERRVLDWLATGAG